MIENKQIGVNKEFNAIGTAKERIRALKKAIATVKSLNEQRNANIDYLWMDQLCINQFDNIEQGIYLENVKVYQVDEIIYANEVHIESKTKSICISINWSVEEEKRFKKEIF